MSMDDVSLGGMQLGLAELALRVGISEGRGRALWSTDRSKLPTPDGSHRGDRPFWYPITVDRWCRDTGRPAPSSARWPLNRPAADGPAARVERRLVTGATDNGDPASVYLTLWDTGVDLVVHVVRVDEDSLDQHIAARIAATAVAPVDWPRTYLLVPDAQWFGEPVENPIVVVYIVTSRDGDRASEPSGLLPELVKVLRWSRRELLTQVADDVTVERYGVTQVEDLAALLGRPVPLWWHGTCTTDTVRQADAANGDATVPVDDTVTAWPIRLHQFKVAIDHDMPTAYPSGFTARSRDLLDTLKDVRTAHSVSDDRGPGWMMAVRPVPPLLAVQLERRATRAAEAEIDPERAAGELPRLRAESDATAWDDDYGAVLHQAARELAGLLYRSHPDPVFSHTVPERIVVSGPITEQYLSTLTPIEPDEAQDLLAKPNRRLARLVYNETNIEAIRRALEFEPICDKVTALYRDQHRRLVAELFPSGRRRLRELALEWPVGMPTSFDDTSVVRADSADGGVFVLTDGPDGTLRTDPLPHPGGQPDYRWGYDGGGPGALYQALIRCAVQDYAAGPWHAWLGKLGRFRVVTGTEGRSESHLWNFIATADKAGPLEVTWRTVRQWVQEDADRVAG